jgi:hypothetical protein
MLLIGLAGACGDEQSVCEAAVDKLKACDVGRVEAEQGYSRLPLISTDDCSGDNECLAGCVAPASCAELIYGIKGGSTDPNTPPVPNGPKFVACVYACME